jgi:hypothetical protein
MNITKSLMVAIALLHLASCVGSAEKRAIKELERMRAAEFFEDSAQQSLALAIERGNLDQAMVALDQGAGANAVGKDGMTPLFWALAKQNIDGFRFLLEQGANPNVLVDLPGNFQDQHAGAMEMAAQLEDSSYLRALLEHGADPNTIVNRSWNEPLLYRAIMSRRPDNVVLLLEFGADVDHRDNAGKTPLIQATTARMFEMALVLLREGADPTIRNQWGNGPADIVVQFGNRGIDRRTNDLAAFDEFFKELKTRGLLQEEPPRFN